jgi:hypothetical protein
MTTKKGNCNDTKSSGDNRKCKGSDERYGGSDEFDFYTGDGAAV